MFAYGTNDGGDLGGGCNASDIEVPKFKRGSGGEFGAERFWDSRCGARTLKNKFTKEHSSRNFLGGGEVRLEQVTVLRDF